jgi:hypothetical protein
MLKKIEELKVIKKKLSSIHGECWHKQTHPFTMTQIESRTLCATTALILTLILLEMMILELIELMNAGSFAIPRWSIILMKTTFL